MPSKKIDFPTNPSKIHDLAVQSEKNAKDHLDTAKALASKGKFGHAYFHLSISLEETGKAHLCYMKIHDKDVKIDDAWLIDAFQKHPPKRLTVLSQSIFHLTNTFEPGVNTKVLAAILNKDTSIYPPIQPIISAFKKMERLRNTALYIEKDGSGPDTITEKDYLELLPICQEASDYSNGFRVPRDRDYRIIHNNIKEMLDEESDQEESQTIMQDGQSHD